MKEAIRVLAPGGRFAFVDLFDDPKIYSSRRRVLDALAEAGGQVDTCEAINLAITLKWPMNTSKVLGYAVPATSPKRTSKPQTIFKSEGQSVVESKSWRTERSPANRPELRRHLALPS